MSENPSFQDPLYNIPAINPPPGITSNFINPPTHARSLGVINGLFTAIAIIMVVVRLYSRTMLTQQQGFGWDDAFCILAMLGSIAHMVVMFLVIPLGYGRHLWDVRGLSLTHERLLLILSNDEIYAITIFLTKTSILLLYFRLFGVYKSARVLVHCGLVLVTIAMIPYLGVAIARSVKCTSMMALVTPLCFTKTVSTTVVAIGAFNAFTDFYTLFIPINRVVKLHIKNKKRIGLFIIFAGGFAACAMSIARLIVIAVNFNNADVWWHASMVSQFSIVEINLAIACSCMMFVPSVYAKFKGTATKLYSPSGSGMRSQKSVSAGSEVKDVELQQPGDPDQLEDFWEKGVPALAPLQDGSAHIESPSAARLRD